MKLGFSSSKKACEIAEIFIFLNSTKIQEKFCGMAKCQVKKFLTFLDIFNHSSKTTQDSVKILTFSESLINLQLFISSFILENISKFEKIKLKHEKQKFWKIINLQILIIWNMLALIYFTEIHLKLLYCYGNAMYKIRIFMLTWKLTFFNKR